MSVFFFHLACSSCGFGVHLGKIAIFCFVLDLHGIYLGFFLYVSLESSRSLPTIIVLHKETLLSVMLFAPFPGPLRGSYS